MKAPSTKGLLFRMALAFGIIVIVMSIKPARAGEIFYPGNLSRVEMQGDAAAQRNKALMPKPLTQQQYIDAQAALAARKQLSTDSVDAVGNNRPNAHFSDTPDQTNNGFKY